jgi:hypothetical protein
MIKNKSLLLFCILGLSFLAPSIVATEDGTAIEEEEDEYVDPIVENEEKALLIAYKHVLEPKIVQGCNMTIVLSVYNVGQGCGPSVSEVQLQGISAVLMKCIRLLMLSRYMLTKSAFLNLAEFDLFIQGRRESDCEGHAPRGVSID